jgi:hypothetical protein
LSRAKHGRPLRSAVIQLAVVVVSVLALSALVTSPANGIFGVVQLTTPPLTTTYTTSTTTTSTFSTTTTSTPATSTSYTTVTSTSTSVSSSSSFTSTQTLTSTLYSSSSVYTNTVTTPTTTTATAFQPFTTTATSFITSTALPSVGCPVAFATSGTPLEPYANFLRGFRNNEVQNTTAGRMFMQTFNGWYYSWAPSVTYTAARNGLFLDVLRVGVYPLIGILYASYYSYAAVSPLSAEAAALTAGLVSASLIGLVYVAPVAYVSLRLVRRRTKFLAPAKAYLLPASGWLAGSALIVGLAYASGSGLLMGLGTASLTLSMLSVGSLLGTQAFASIQFPAVNLHAKAFAVKRMARPLR